MDRSSGTRRTAVSPREGALRADGLYDLASVTKVAGTTLAVMKLVDRGRLDLEAPLSRYLPELAAQYPAHGAIVLRDLLTHQAGLVAFVPYHRSW
ncbi:MAG: serine hydrolase domain-containing protein [Flavobacteriales bacterium]